jgi:hypothetical protein
MILCLMRMSATNIPDLWMTSPIEAGPTDKLLDMRDVVASARSMAFFWRKGTRIKISGKRRNF